jgi:exonuclease III
MTSSSTLKIVTWNINDGVLSKLPLLENLANKFDIVCVQEHFLSAEGLQLLQLNENVNVFGIPSRRSGRGRPSGGVAIIVRAST